MLFREQRLPSKELTALRSTLPFPVPGFDNDNVFMKRGCAMAEKKVRSDRRRGESRPHRESAAAPTALTRSQRW